MDSTVDSLFDISEGQPSESFIWECEIVDQRSDCSKKEELKPRFGNHLLDGKSWSLLFPQEWGDLRAKPSETAGGHQEGKEE